MYEDGIAVETCQVRFMRRERGDRASFKVSKKDKAEDDGLYDIYDGYGLKDHSQSLFTM